MCKRIIESTYIFIKELFERVNRRPLVIPAILAFTSSSLSFVSRNSFCLTVFSILIELLIILVLAICSKEYKRTLMYFLVILLCFSSIRFRYINKKISYDFKSYNATVIEVSLLLDGTHKCTVDIDNIGKSIISTEEDVQLGDRVTFIGELCEPNCSRNPGEFDYKNFLEQKGIFICVENPKILSICHSSNVFIITANEISSFIFKIKTYMIDTVGKGYDELTKGLVASICLGDKSLVDNEVVDYFSSANCSHILAVSGSHFSSYLMLLPVITDIFFKEKRGKSAIYIAICFAISILTGWTDSVSRALCMSLCSYFSRDSYSGMALAAIVMIVGNPFCSLSIGFRMSFAACLSIKVFSYEIQKRFKSKCNYKRFLNPFIILISSQIGLMLFWVETNYRIGLIHILVSLLATFIASVACISFFPSILISSFFPLISPVSICCNLLYKLLRKCCLFSNLAICSAGLEQYLVIALLLFGIIKLLPSCAIKKTMMKPISLVLISCILLNIGEVVLGPDAKIIFIDVGQGDSCLVLSKDKCALIDTGTEDYGTSTVLPLLDFYGISKLDYLYISHWDEDHSGSTNVLIESNRVRKIIVSSPNEKVINQDLVELVTNEPSISLSKSITISYIQPNIIFDNANDNSMVLRVSCNDVDILFTGDISIKAETALIESNLLPECEIVKIAHHGSSGSTSDDFLDRVKPEFAVISVGANNRYGHPAVTTLERLESFDVSYYSTSQNGAIIVTISGNRFSVSSFREANIRWPLQQVL